MSKFFYFECFDDVLVLGGGGVEITLRFINKCFLKLNMINNCKKKQMFGTALN